eukprot:CAMPEP_0119110108 /NCGR_PEP_ID=MMETSP1180-20130426/26854_1 /TAXON_ID=3052 ORGANISM="Chlamydomonas cf sp, Strain CCMP681" /NCGR_SAMPLE_ID=MMETSP1180 /ASSEMBLY_ACC=CAM_ASM_000741 /LENGTH=97 /DNA_ID=CAMNT_0007096251 /DNA_START=119 /DNA_END=412 /DNA_ORIENTATION=-
MTNDKNTRWAKIWEVAASMLKLASRDALMALAIVLASRQIKGGMVTASGQNKEGMKTAAAIISEGIKGHMSTEGAGKDFMAVGLSKGPLVCLFPNRP